MEWMDEGSLKGSRDAAAGNAVLFVGGFETGERAADGRMRVIWLPLSS